MTEITLSLGPVQPTTTSLGITGQMTEAEWLEIGRTLARIERATLWWIGDWWAFGEHRYGDRTNW